MKHVLEQPTVARAFLRAVAENGDREAVREFGTGRSMTYDEWLARSGAVAGGLAALGVERGDRVALLMTNRLEFHIVDMGAVLLGAASFSLYNTAPVEQLLFNVDNAEPSVLIAEAQFADRARELVALRPQVKLLVLEEDLEALEASGAGFDVVASAEAVEPGDLLTLVYTSGTTGAPKGVQYLHSGLMYAVWAFADRLQPVYRGRNVSYLPMAHIAERQIGYYSALCCGMTITTLIDARDVQAALLEVRPTWFFGVPRIYEKVEVAMLEHVRDDATRAALDAAVERVRKGEPWVDDPRLAALREATGLEHAGWAGISGAPCSREMAERFHAIGIPLSEAWGMSETVIGTGAAPDRIRIGAAGWPYSGTEIRLAEDGEILLKSPSVTPGYLKDPERTAEAFTPDGFIKTGDLARFDDDGYLWVVGRKKDIIINSAGKNMSPVNIEQAIRGTDSVMAQVVVFGDGRPYNVGLIVLDPLAASALAGEALEPRELAHHPTVVAHVARVVEEGNARLSRVEQLKRYTIYEGVWSPGGDELTLTNKLKRADVNAKYAALVDDLYLTPAASERVMLDFSNMNLATIELTQPEPGIVVATLNRPERMNAQTFQMFDDLAALPLLLRDEDELRALIITGAGDRAFCAGFDLAEIDRLTEFGVRQFLKFQELATGALAAIRGLPVPVIAAINGAAAGGGMALALTADIRLASPNAKINAAFVKIGLSVGELGTSWTLTRLVGPGRAAEIAYTGRQVHADEAERIGLVNRVVPAESLLDEAIALALSITQNSSGGVRMSKRALQANQEVASYAAALELENRGQALLTRGSDMPEALAAFKEKREPVFTRR